MFKFEKKNLGLSQYHLKVSVCNEKASNNPMCWRSLPKGNMLLRKYALVGARQSLEFS